MCLRPSLTLSFSNNMTLFDWKGWSMLILLTCLGLAIYYRPSSSNALAVSELARQVEERAAWKFSLLKPYPFIVGEVEKRPWNHSDRHFAETVRVSCFMMIALDCFLLILTLALSETRLWLEEDRSC